MHLLLLSVSWENLHWNTSMWSLLFIIRLITDNSNKTDYNYNQKRCERNILDLKIYVLFFGKSTLDERMFLQKQYFKELCPNSLNYTVSPGLTRSYDHPTWRPWHLQVYNFSVMGYSIWTQLFYVNLLQVKTIYLIPCL